MATIKRTITDMAGKTRVFVEISPNEERIFKFNTPPTETEIDAEVAKINAPPTKEMLLADLERVKQEIQALQDKKIAIENDITKTLEVIK